MKSINNVVKLIAAGDVQWSRVISGEEWGDVSYDKEGESLMEGGWQPIPRLISAETMPILKEKNAEFLRCREQQLEMEWGGKMDSVTAFYNGVKPHNLKFTSDLEWAKYPFQKVANILRQADISFINLENPISDSAPRVGMFRVPTTLTQGFVDAGIDIISLANNHMMDAQIWGLYDTLASLNKAGVNYIGAGKNLDDARKPYIVEKKGIKIAFLAYSQYDNNGPHGFATPVHAGIVPLDPLIIKEDIKQVRSQVDQVILSFHWDIFSFDPEKSYDLHPDAVAFAHDIIDAGADAILGHGPHAPRAVEYYRGKPIIYSLAHLIMSIGLPMWGDNFVAQLNITKKDIPSVEIMPVAGKFKDLSQPYFLMEERAIAVLKHLQKLSENMGGNLKIDGYKAILTDK